ncbi:MAG: bifunctional riboflavin kinase/FAD synthetase [Planctomycetota bacterium]
MNESVATLGVFDGVHLGHQEVMCHVREGARELGVPGVVITFDRHPTDVLQCRPEPFITSLEHRLQLFEDLGIDATVVIEFAENIAQMPAREFARCFFGTLLGVDKLVLGFDARFGHEAGGDVQLCRAMSDELDMETEQVSPVYVEGEVASSTRVRSAVQNADLDMAEKLLGRPFSLLGTVVHGAGLGQELGYPTANLDVHHELVPEAGVYATWIHVDDGAYRSVTSVGTRKTFPDLEDDRTVVEVHLINEEMDLYGKDVEVQFEGRLRAQKRFSKADQLVDQISEDVETARNMLQDGD